jgi:hypothetical protein
MTTANFQLRHGDQRIHFPVGTIVKALVPIAGPFGVIAEGTFGKVTNHYPDGRAMFQFDNHIHTLHCKSWRS